MTKRPSIRRPNARAAFLRVLREQLWGGVKASFSQHFAWLQSLVVKKGHVRVPKVSRGAEPNRGSRTLLTPEGLEVRKLLAADVFLAGSNDADEGGAGSFIVALEGGTLAPAGGVVVEYVISGTADEVDDYFAIPDSVTIAEGANAAAIPILAINDDVLELLETVNISITAATGTGAAVSTVAPTEGSLVIKDLDAAIVSLTASDSTASEVGPDNGEFLLEILSTDTSQPRSVTADTALLVTLSIAGTATNGGDYETIESVVTISPTGTLPVSELAIPVEVIPDADNFDPETVIISVTGVSTSHPSVTFDGTAATVSIADPDRPQATITSSPTSLDEGDELTFTVALDTAATADATLAINFSGDVEAGDLSAMSIPVSFTVGQSEAVVSVTAVDDALVEAAEEVIAELSYVGGNVALGATTSASATISESDATSLTVTGDSVTEGSDATLTFTLGAPVGEETVFTFDLNGSNADTTSPADFSTSEVDVTFAASATIATVVVSTVADTLVEGDEVVLATLTGSPAIPVTLSPTLGTIDIVDGDSAEYSIADTSNVESQNAVFEISLTTPSQSPVTLSYDVSSGTAVSTADFTGAPSGQVVIPAGSTTYDLTIAVVNDNLVEQTEDFTVSLAGVVSPVGVITAGDDEAEAEIIDNDAATLNLQAPVATIAEGSTLGGGGSQNFTLVLSNPVSEATTVTIDLSGGTADVGDFTPASTSIVIPAGTQVVQIPVSVTPDTVVEDDETILATVGTPTTGSGLSVSSGSSATMTIIDDDSAEITFDETVSVTEASAAVANVTLTIGNDVDSETVIDYTLVPQSGQSGASTLDYTGISGSVTLGTVSGGTAVIAIPIVDDAIIEADQTFTISLSKASGDPSVTLDGSTATVVISDNDSAEVELVRTSAAGPITEEDSGSTDVEYELSLQSAGTVVTSDSDVTIVVAGVAGSATTGDFNAAEQTLVIPAGSTEAVSYTASVEGDVLVEADESFTVSLTSVDASGSNASITAGTDADTVSIIDDDQAEVSLSGPATIAEETGEVVVTLSLDAVEVDTTVTIATSPGTAVSSDYGLGNTVVLTAGQTSETVTISITDDGIDEADESFTIGISGVSSTADVVATSLDEVVVTIIDNDDATVAVSGPTSVTEGPSVTADFTISLEPSDADVTVTYTTVDGSAEDTLDYVGVAGSVVIPGSTIGSEVVIPVDIVNDSDVETLENFSLSITGISGGNSPVAGATVAEVDIVDDDSSVLSVTGPASVSESDGQASFTISLPVRTADATIFYEVAPGTALDGDDLVATSGTIVIPAATSQTIVAVDIVNDSLVEANEDFTFNISLVDDGGVSISLGADEVTTTIDDEDQAVATISRFFDASEILSGLTGRFTVSLSNPVSEATTINYSVSPTSPAATAGDDYQTLSGSVVIPANSLTANIDIVPVLDTLVEGDELVALALTGASTTIPLSVTASSTPATLTIQDDDTATIDVTGGTVAEGDSGSAPVTFTLSMSEEANSAVTVDYTFTGSASAPLDHDGTAGSVIFAIGETEKTVVVNVLGDTVVEGDEVLTLALGTPTGNPGVTAGTDGAYTITDDDSAEISLLAADLTVSETDNAQFLVVLSTVAQHDTTVTLLLSGSATADEDYADPISKTVVVPGGSNSSSLLIDLTEDLLLEGNETIIAELDSVFTATGDISIGSPSIATITITDSDVGEVSIVDAASLTFAEDSGTAVVTVTLSTPSDADTIVSYSLTDDSAKSTGVGIAESDYDSTAGSITIADGETIGLITISLTDDAVVEQDEVFGLSLTGVTGNGATTASPSDASVTIADDDTAEVVFAPTSISVNEADAPTSVTLTISQTAVSDQPTTITYTVGGVSDTADSLDYSVASNVAVIDAGSQTVEIFAAISADTLVEDTETFSITLSSTVGDDDVTIGADSTAVVSITDDDASVVAIPGGISVNESAGEVVVTLSLTNPAASDITLDYAVALTGVGATDAAAADFDPAGLPSGTVVIPSGSATYPLTIALNDDNIIEQDETFELSISNLTGATSISIDSGADTATVTINSEDAGVLRILPTVGSINEGDADSTSNLFLLTLSDASSTDTTVEYSISGTADAGTDYDAIPTTTVIPAGTQSLLIPVTLLGDTLVENDEVITVSLQTSSNSDILIDVTSNDVADATIVNDDGMSTLSLTSSAASITEGGEVVFTLSLSEPVGGTNVVSYTITGSSGGTTNEGFFDSADAPTSLFQDTNATLGAGEATFAEGVQEWTITIDAIDDDVLESLEGVNFEVTGVDGVTNIVSPPAAVSVEIADNDISELVIVGDVNGNEAGLVDGQFRLVLTKPADTDIAVDINDLVMGPLAADQAQPGPAPGAGNDFLGLSPGATFVVPSGESSLQIPVTIFQDADAELPERIQYNATGIASGDYSGSLTLVSGSDVAEITILDDDAASVTIDDITVSETVGSTDVTIELAQAVPTEVTLTYTFTNGSALLGEDYSGSTSSVIVPANSLSVVVPATILDDDIVEGQESYTISLTDYSSTVPVGLSLGDGRITIDSEDTAEVTVVDTSVGEDDQTMVLQLSLDKISDEPTTVTLDITGGTAGTADYTPEATITAVIPASTTIADITIGMTDEDTDLEGAETVEVSISGVDSPYAISGTGNTGTFTILDNELLDVSISTNTAEISETGGAGSLTISLAAPVDNAVTVNFDIGGDASTADYTLGSSVAVIPAGSLSVELAITPIADTLNEFDEDIQVSISTVDGFADSLVTGLGDSATVTILDDDTPKVSVSFDATSVEEDDAATLVISLDKPATDEFTLGYTLGGDATDPGDYSGLSGSVVVPVSATVVSVPVTIVNDSSPEIDETLEVSLDTISTSMSLAYPAAIISTPDTATLTIVDDDTPFLTVSKLADAVDPDGDTGAGTNGVFLINLSSATGTPTTVTFSYGGDASASDTLDYSTSAASTVVIPAGQMNAFVTITPANDGVVEENQTVEITLDSYTGDPLIEIVPTSDDTATLTIKDQDEAIVSIDIPDGSVTEGNSFDFVVTLDKPTENGFDLDLNKLISPNSGTGTPDTNLADPLSVPGGVTSFTVSVEAAADTIVEADETLSVEAQVAIATDYDGRLTANTVSLANEDAIVIEDNDTLQVVGTPVINGGAIQRSRVNDVVLVFNGEVDKTTELGNFEVRNRDTLLTVDLSTSTFVYNTSSGKTVVTLKFSGAQSQGGSLTDGNWELNISSALKDVNGNLFDGDGNGTTGDGFTFGNLESDNFYRLFGDSFGDRSVDIFDQFAFNSAFGSLSDVYSIDGSGPVDVFDEFAFNSNFGTTLSF